MIYSFFRFIIFIILLSLLQNIANSFDICLSYKFNNTQVIPDRTCTDNSQYCCGDCDFKFCCNNITIRFNQTNCKNTLINQIKPTDISTSPTKSPQANEVCQPYKITHLNRPFWIPEQKCNGSYCCGNCDNRYCCDDFSIKLDQSICVETDICNSYTDTSFTYQKGIICGIQTPYCCGSCYDRFCCNQISSRLNQQQCVPYSTTTKITTRRTTIQITEASQEPEVNDKTLIYAFVGSGIFLVCLAVFSIPVCVFVYNYRRRVKEFNRRMISNIQMTDLSAVNNVVIPPNDKPPSYKEVIRSKKNNIQPPEYQEETQN